MRLLTATRRKTNSPGRRKTSEDVTCIISSKDLYMHISFLSIKFEACHVSTIYSGFLCLKKGFFSLEYHWKHYAKVRV